MNKLPYVTFKTTRRKEGGIDVSVTTGRKESFYTDAGPEILNMLKAITGRESDVFNVPHKEYRRIMTELIESGGRFLYTKRLSYEG